MASKLRQNISHFNRLSYRIKLEFPQGHLYYFVHKGNPLKNCLRYVNGHFFFIVKIIKSESGLTEFKVFTNLYDMSLIQLSELYKFDLDWKSPISIFRSVYKGFEKIILEQYPDERPKWKINKFPLVYEFVPSVIEKDKIFGILYLNGKILSRGISVLLSNFPDLTPVIGAVYWYYPGTPTVANGCGQFQRIDLGCWDEEYLQKAKQEASEMMQLFELKVVSSVQVGSVTIQPAYE